MPVFSRPASFGAIDRFDDGTGLFSLPLEYHDIFRTFRDLGNHFATTTTTDEYGHEITCAEPLSMQLVVRQGTDLLYRIAAASYGGLLPTPLVPNTFFRPGSLDELGLIAPPLFSLFSYTQGRLPLENPLPTTEFRYHLDVLCTAVADTHVWLGEAQSHTNILGWRTSWYWSYPQGVAADIQLGPVPVWPAAPAEPELPGTPNDAYDDPATNLVIPATCNTVILHPVFSSAASNSVVSRSSPSDDLVPTASTSTALIPHPIYGPGAQNALVRYGRSQTPWTDATPHNPIVPPNSPAIPDLPCSLPDPEGTSAMDEDESENGGAEALMGYGSATRLDHGDAPNDPIYIDCTELNE
ncbi:hypothetical protein C8Q79DRAFT_924230 [Trametes meyenii]|nr:hypothetical protein C8Q79DRAFT_924230 [Trametes meyenii]